MKSGFNDHDFRCLDESSRRLAFLEAHFAHGIRSDQRRDLLSANGEDDLSHQSAGTNVHNATDKLVAAADTAKTRPQLWTRLLLRSVQQAVNLALRNTVMPARCLNRAQLSLVHPLLQRRITHTQYLSRITWGK